MKTSIPRRIATTVVLGIVTIVVISPVFFSIVLSFRPNVGSPNTSVFTIENFTYVLTQTSALIWLGNSLLVALATVAFSILIAVPAGYALSRVRNSVATPYSFALFIVQSLPGVVSVIPMFVLFVSLGLVDNLVGLVIIFVGSNAIVTTWMMFAYFNTIPRSLEEAAWIDGCAAIEAFFRIVTPNSLPAIASAAIFAFLTSWNDYLASIVFLKTQELFTLPVGMQSFFQQFQANWGGIMAIAVIMLVPPILVFSLLNKFFNLGGIGGAIAGQ